VGFASTSSNDNLQLALHALFHRAKYNKDLHLVTPKKPQVQVPQPSVAELLLPDQINQFFGVIRDIRNDPKTMAFTTLAKIADYAGKRHYCNS
jgi:hypothetical protein